MTRPPENECRRYVDMWALPGIHPTNLRLLQLLKAADSSQFTKGMQVVGTISEVDAEDRWHQTHLLGLRTDLWQPNRSEMERSLRAIKRQRKQQAKRRLRLSGRLTEDQSERLEQKLEDCDVWNMEVQDIESRRLVLRLFKSTGRSTNWCGSIEELTSAEIPTSMGSRRRLLTLAVNLPRTQHVTIIQENHCTFRWPAMFSFGYYDGQRMWYVRLQQRWVSLGPDFDVFVDGDPIGLVDGKLLCFGSDSYIDLADHPLVNDTQFLDLLTLFTASVGYHRAMRKGVGRRIAAVLRGQSHRHLIDADELRLRHNGRAAA